VLEIFAHQASSMIENTRLFMESERSAQLEAQLNDILNAVASSLELSQIAQAIAEGVKGMVSLVNLDLVITNEETGGFDAINATVNNDGHFVTEREELFSLEYTAMANAYEGRRDQLYVAGEDTDLVFSDLSRWQATGEQASLLLPLLAGGENLGVMHIGLADTTSLTPEIRQLLVRMARLVAGSIQNARLFNQAVNLQILTSSVVESIQQGIIVMDHAGNVINFNDFMRQQYAWDNHDEARHLFEYSPEWEGFMQEQLRSVLEDGIPRELIEQVSPKETGSQVVRNFYLYPLRSETEIRGAVLLVEDVTQRAELEKAIESRANQLAALTEVSTRITASLEREEVIQMAIDEIGWIIPNDAVSLWRRIGSYMTLEHYNGIESQPRIGMRVLIREVERFNEIVEYQHTVAYTDDKPLAISELPGDDEDVRSWLGVPLISQGHVSGVLVLTRHKAESFDPRAEQHVARAFASQVAIALANADLFEQTFERTNEMGIMLEAAQATSLTRDLDSVFATVADLLFNALEMAECAILIWDEVDDEMVVQFSRTRDESVPPSIYEGDTFTVSEFPARKHAIQMREVVVIMDVEDDGGNPMYPTELTELRNAGFTVRMLVPLIVTNRPIGLIMLQQNADHPELGVSQQKMRLARALGLQVAAAIENARLSRETHVRFEELLTINSLSQAVSATLNLDDMLPMVRDQLPSVTGAGEMYLALYDEERDLITFPMAVRNGEAINIPSRPLGDDEVSYIIKHRRSLNLGADYFSIDQIRKNLGIETSEPDALSYLGVPLTVGSNVLGALAIRDTQRKHAFDINAERVLATVSSQLAAAIQNARLYERVQASAASLESIVRERTDELEAERDRLDTLYQITSELTRTLDMEQLLDRALGMVSKAVSASDGVIILMDPSIDGLTTRAWLDPNTIYNVDGRTYHAAEALANWLMIQNELNEPIVLVDDLSQEDYWDTALPHAAQFKSAMAVILENNDEPVGVMVLLSTELAAFDDNHLKLLVPAANQVAASINSADLYQLIRDQAARLANLVRQEKETSQRSNSVLESIADGVMLADATGHIVSFNAAAERILRIKRNEAEGQPVSTLSGLYGTSAARWSDMIENWSAQMEGRDLAGSDAYFVEERIELGNRVISAAIAPVTMESGELLGTVSVFRDITRDVEADRIKSEFIENVSHEFRTPLTPIKGYTDLLLQGATGQLNTAQQSMINVIKENVERLTALVDDVLNIAQLDRSGMLALVQEADVRQIITEVAGDLSSRPANAAKKINLSIDIADDVPLIHADNQRLAQVVTNLLDNAFKFTRAGGDIDIKTVKEGADHILISVSDTGVGVPEEFYDRIWQRFERYEQHALEMEVSGTGLGLPLVKELVTMHGGEIWFNSEIDKGTTFFVRLPIDQPGYRRLVGDSHPGVAVEESPESVAGD
ncbi:MAG: GAF domain-containing protein, partial [Anaerolineae bacterium]|nr:GAF domain-containing protein [Anaerolineae bacterium]